MPAHWHVQRCGGRGGVGVVCGRLPLRDVVDPLRLVAVPLPEVPLRLVDVLLRWVEERLALLLVPREVLPVRRAWVSRGGAMRVGRRMAKRCCAGDIAFQRARSASSSSGTAS